MAGLIETLNNTRKIYANGKGLLSSIAGTQNTNNSVVNSNPSVLDLDAKEEASQDNGGFLGGIGYLGEKIVLGFLSGIEGIWDYTAGGFAKLFGADDWAEQQFANDWVDYNHADEWYNPSSGWKVAGDVAGGIGTSLPAIAGVGLAAAGTAAVTYFSGGALTPVVTNFAASVISATIAGLGAAGNATKEAYRETGQLTGKEFGYGALSGATEAGVEFLSAGLAKGSGRIVSSIAKSTSKEVTETVAKTGAKTIFKQLGEDFVSEAFEEGLSEILSPVYQIMTYNPDAESASPQEVAYAAMIGGLSGVVMSGSRVAAGAAVNTTKNYISGNNSVKNGTVDRVMAQGERIAKAESKHQTGYEAFQGTKETYDKLKSSLATTDGKVTTVHQKMLLGKLKSASTVSYILPYVERSARGLVFSADVAAERYSTFGITDDNGKPLKFTAEQLLDGIDTELLAKAKEGTLTDKEARKFALSLRKAIQNNPVLSPLAVAEATGQIMLDTQKIAESLLNGQNIANATDLNYLIEHGSQEEMNALGEAFGIDDWSKVTVDDLHARVSEFNGSGRISEYAEQLKRVHKAAKQESESAKPLPHILRRNMTDGVYRYKSGDGTVDMAVIKEGDNYFLYDYDGRNISRALTMQDVNKVLRRFWTSGHTTTAKSMQNNRETAIARDTAEIEAIAREAVGEDYNKLNEPNKAAIRMTVRQARAHGLSDVQVRTFAKVAAKSGLNVIFDAERAFGDGAISGNTIYVNPNNSEERTYEVILGHEMFHKLFAEGDKHALKLFTEARELLEKNNPEKAQGVRERYKKFYKKLGTGAATAHTISEEEVAAAGAEEVFRSADAWAYILSKEPSFADKVLSFFRKSAREYSSVQGLSAQARKFVRQYKALFESLSERNRGNNALALTLEGAGVKKAPATNTETNSVHVTGDNDEEAPATTNTDVDTDTRYALLTDEDLAEYMATGKTLHTRHKKQRMLENGKKPILTSESEIREFISNAIHGKAGGEVRAFARVPKRLAEAISDVRSTLDLEGDYLEFQADALREAYKVHSSPKMQGDIALSESDFENLHRHIFDFDGVLSVNDYNGKTEVHIYRRAENGYYQIITVSSSERKSLQITKLIGVSKEKFEKKYAKKIERNTGSPRMTEASNPSTKARHTAGALSNDIISENAEKGNPSDENSSKNPPKKRFALPETDSNGNKLTDRQREYFKDSKIVDENGNLLVMYHGTTNYEKIRVGKYNDGSYKYDYRPFTVFKKQYDEQIGHFFSKDADNAGGYGSKLYEVYLNITNPLIIDCNGRNYSAILFEEKYYDTYELAEIAKDRGYNGLLLRNVSDGVDFGTLQTPTDDAVAFYSNQIKKIDNHSPSLLSDIRFALTENAESIEKYTEKQYNSFGWARYAEALSKNELDDLYSKIQARTTLRTFKQSSKGEAIIEVNKKPHTTLDVDNVFVFVKGKKNDFTISRVVRFNAETETEMDLIKEDLYEGRTWSDTYYSFYRQEGFAKEYRRENTESFEQYNQEVRRRSLGQTSRGTNQDNRQSGKYRSGYSLTVGENGEVVERFALTGDEDLDAIFGDIDMNEDADGASFDIEAVLERGIPRKPGTSNLTIGEMKKIIANNTHYKVFSKGKALEVIGKMIGTSDLTAKTRAKLADALWQGFNDCTDLKSRQTFARDMAEFIVATMVTEAKVENPDVMKAQERLSYLSTYLGKITFRTDDLSEIRHIVDKAGLKKILGRWGYKGKKGTNRVPMDVFTVDIAREMPGMSELEKMHPVEAFMELDSMYERAREDVKDKWISAYWEATDADMLSLVAGIEADIMKAFETEGELSKFTKIVEGRIEYYSTRAEFWKAEHDRIKGRDRILGLLMSQAQKMKELRLGTFANATQFDSELFKNSIEKLAKIQFRGNLNVSGTRKIMGELLQWYRKDNPLLEFVDEKNPGLYVQSVADMLEFLSEGKKGFSKEELLTMYDVMSYFVKFVENYGKVFRNGKMIEALPEAQRYIGIAQSNEGLKVGLFAKLAGSWYAEMFNDPATLVRRMDYYERGFYTEMFEDLREAATDAEIAEMRIMREYDEFLRSNKNWLEKASEELIEYRGQKIPKIKLIDLYMTIKRKQAWAGIALNGFPFKNLEGKVVRVPGFLTDEHISETELEAAITAQQTEIAKHFTEVDRQYMAILEKGYNEDARKLKADRDMQRLGFTNATTDYYYPIRRAYTAQNIDTSDAQAEYDRVTNSSFNKDIVKGAKQEIAIESADERFRRHIHAVCQYAYLSPAIETFNRLYNMDTSGNRNHPVSVRTATENGWAKGNKYFMKLISDIQGIPTGSSEGMAVLSFVRGSYAKFQLGANPKVWLTQISSIFASSSILDADSIARGAFISADGVDQYCPLAELRNYDNTAAMAQGVLDKQGKVRGAAGRAIGKVGKFSDLLMKPIGMMDRFVVCRVFGACQVQVEKNGGAKVGTEANKIEAGKLLKKVILETQQNSIATERSAAMRSGNEILRTVTMFTADSMKVIGRVVDAFGEISVLNSKIKAATDPEVKSELKARLKVAKRNARKAATALVLTAVFMASIAQLFRHIYDKEQKEDETVAQTMIVDAVGNLFGGLPLVKDVYARVFEGYDFDNYAYSSVNDLLDSAVNLFDTAGNIIGGEASSQDVARGVKNLSYSVGQLTGLPVRNVYNVFYGLTKRFNPETAYKIDNVFYEKNYKNDFYKAIENDDVEMASFILSLLYNERMGADMSEAVHSELYSLSAKGYKVLPKSAPKSITVDGAEYELSETQQAAVRGSYSASRASLEKLFTKEKYKKLSDEMKAEAVNYVYDLHYDMALEDALSVDRGNAVLISSVVGAENLALLHVATKGLTSDTDKLGNTISGSKRKKVVEAINRLDVSNEQKLLLICAKGYALKDGDLRGLSAERAKKLLLRYILSMGKLNKQHKAELAAMCGFDVKNGKIMLKTAS